MVWAGVHSSQARGCALPRGVAIPELREQLFQAAERVLAREGPSGLTGRAVTREAGVATGVLHSHFTDFEEFLVELIFDRARLAVESVGGLLSRPGEGMVAGNLTEAALSFGVKVPAMASLVVSRPALSVRLSQALAAGAPGLDAIERAVASYLEAERRLRRLAPDADTEVMALMFVATVHHLWATQGADGPGFRDRVDRIAAALLGLRAPAARAGGDDHASANAPLR
jgi:AcrR family transcriptional regulator